MPATVRAVVDTNLFVSGLLGGASRRLLDLWQTDSFILVVSEALLAELYTVIQRPKFQPYFSSAEPQALISAIITRAQIVAPSLRLSLCRDPKDNFLLDLAAESRADFLVTGDRDLLDVSVVQPMKRDYGTQIVTLRAFLDQFEE